VKAAAAPRSAPALLGLMAWWGYLSGVHGSIAPLLARSFALSDAEIAGLFSWIGVASLLALALGRAADRIGRRRALLVCAAGLPLAAAASALAADPRAYLVAQLAAFGLGAPNGCGGRHYCLKIPLKNRAASAFACLSASG